MRVKKSLMLWAVVFALALPLMLVGTASARFASDGAVQDGTTGGWKAPADGVCVVSLAPDGTMVIDSTITNKRDCSAKLVDVTAVTSGDTLANVCGKPASNTAGVKYAAPGSSTCVTVDGSNFITGSISLKNLDSNGTMCTGLTGTLANGSGVQKVANGTSAKCVAYGWQFRGQDADGAPLTFGAKGTAADVTDAGFCYVTLRTGITTTAECPSSGTDVRAKFGYSMVGGTQCVYAYGINGPLNAAVTTAIDGTAPVAGDVVDLSAKTMGECLAGGFTWVNWVPKDGTTTLASGAIIATFDHNKRDSGSNREGCLHCHSTVNQENGPVERWKDSFLKTGHKNMLRKVTAGKNWAGPNDSGVLEIYTEAAEGTINFTNATANVSEGADLPLLYLFGDWMAPAPGGLDVVVNNGGFGKYNGGSNYTCAACHTTGWSNSTAGLCSISSNATEAACTTAGGTWVPTTGQQGVVGQEPAASFPGITFTGAGNWDLDGITCARCHGQANPTPTVASTEVPVSGGHNNNIYKLGKKINSLCYGCHQSPAKTASGTGVDIDTANPQNIPAKMVSTASGTVGEFSGHVLGNSFLNSPHAKFTGTITPNSLGKWDIGTGTYASTFAGKACFQGAASSSPAATKADGSEINGKAECEALYGAGAFKTALTDTGVDGAGNCTTCHDVHNSLFVAGMEEKALRRGCETCHDDTAGNGYASSGVPQIGAMSHPTGSNTPWDNAKFVNACETCHMPKATSGGFPMHLWRLNTDAAYSTFPSEAEFNAGMKIANVADDNGYAGAVWVDLDLACGQCHSATGLNYVDGIPVFTKVQLAGAADALHAGGSSNNAACLACHSTVQGSSVAIVPGTNHHAIAACTSCHTASQTGKHFTKPVMNALDATSVTNVCQGCHAAMQGLKRAIITSGTGDNHHKGSSTTTSRSVAGCLYCHNMGGVPFGDASTEVMQDAVEPNTCNAACHGGTLPSAGEHHTGEGLALTNNTTCLTCHTVGSSIVPGGTDPALYAGDLTKKTGTTANAYCQTCHSLVTGGTVTFRAIITSGTGDNHHNGSSTSTARSLAGCLYCHGEVGGVKFGTATTVVMQNSAPGACNGVCHGGQPFAPGDHHTGEGLALTNNTTCLTCHTVGSSIVPGGTDPALYAGDLTKKTGTTANAYCQTCHASETGGSVKFRAIITSGTGDNHHNGSSTSTARSLAGCLYCHGEVGGVKFGEATTAVMVGAVEPNTCNGACHGGTLPSAGEHHTGEGLALTNNTTCLTCHTVGSSIVPGGTDPALYAGDLTKKTGTTANAYCQTCHASETGGSVKFRAIVTSGTGDNHHNGSSTTTARSLAGCLYCHGEVGGVKFGTAVTTEVMVDAVAPTSCSGACHASSQAASGTHHTGATLTPVNGILCFACHKGGDATTLQPGVNALPANWASCQACHSSVTFNRNIMSAAPTCDTCHASKGVVGGTTYTNSIGQKPVSVDVACGQCHGGAMTTVTTNGASYVSSADLATGAAMIHGTGTMPVPTYARFTWSTVPTTDYQVVLNASTSTCEGTCTYEWSFAPADASGAIASGMTTTHTFSSAATVTVTLTATGANGIDHRSKAVTPKYVAALPTTVTMGTNTIAGTTATVGYSLSGGQAPYTVKTVWGDGKATTISGVAAGANTTVHTYVSAGTYTVSITAQDSGVAGGNVTSMRRTTTVTVVPSVLTVSGLVTRPTGTPVYNASVTLKLNGVAKKLAYTNVSGNFTMTGVAPGTYTISVAKSGLIFTNPTATISVVSSMVTPTIMSQN